MPSTTAIFLMEGLDGVMSYAMGAVIQHAGDAYLGELRLCPFGIKVGKLLRTGPEQDLDLNALADHIPQDSLDR